ncbi:ABC-type glycerol-3-phosphate transport system substrate-binding protein [Anaerotaenia torta]|uniref:ABC transporter substrate-binding protein n=1 Tax=Anaerotaenia torta TaxID=433293 RepID=UPI003D24D0A7
MKKKLAILLCFVMLGALLAGCKKEAPANSTADKGEKKGAESQTIFGSEVSNDIAAELTVFTNRTDLIDTVFQDYIKEFNKLYPNVKIEYEAMTNYEEDVTIRLTTENWGDICMIPKTVALANLGDFFVPFGTVEELSPVYNFVTEKASGGKVYGLPWACTAQGVVYNKKVFEAAGVTQIPKTPEEFLAAMQKIKDNTNAIPYYTNYAAGWPLSAWEDYCFGGATGDENYRNNVLPREKEPFSSGTPHYTVYKLMYDLANKGLIEDDPTTTDWEACKGMLGRGEIGAMALGSWSVVQMQDQSTNRDDIGYMPFPITVDGKQYATAAADYCFGINVNSTEEEILASKAYINWLTSKSGFAASQGSISVIKADPLPATLQDFVNGNVKLIASAPATAENEGLFDKINDRSEVGLTSNEQKARIIEAAIGVTKESFDDIMKDWNEKWTKVQAAEGIQ